MNVPTRGEATRASSSPRGPPACSFCITRPRYSLVVPPLVWGLGREEGESASLNPEMGRGCIPQSRSSARRLFSSRKSSVRLAGSTFPRISSRIRISSLRRASLYVCIHAPLCALYAHCSEPPDHPGGSRHDFCIEHFDTQAVPTFSTGVVSLYVTQIVNVRPSPTKRAGLFASSFHVFFL